MNGILIDIIQVFRKRHGDLGSLITIEYSLVIDSVDVSGRYIREISGIHFLYSRDSTLAYVILVIFAIIREYLYPHK